MTTGFANYARNRTAVSVPARVCMALLLAACSPQPADPAPEVDPNPDEPVFVGSEQCQFCHSAEFEQWLGSHHELAMQPASSKSVLGDFSGISFSYFETTSEIFRADGKFFVRTEDGDGAVRLFEVTHTFGVEPLQQYLVDAPGGRKQALQIVWDSRPAERGGQRWYHLYPDEYIGPGDPLHWTGRLFTWNSMCAECHSTNLQASYDVDSDAFNTSYSEVSVGCEACHGPGSRHLSQAQTGSFDDAWGLAVDLDDRRDGAWIMHADTGIAELSTRAESTQQVESCGRCHSRRSVIAEDYEYGVPLLDTHMVSLLDEHLYHADGRIQDEVYVYGSFLQSRMYAAGVTCSDCHNPHSGQLHTGPDPNDICATCHLPARFATAEHADENTGNCVDCHMRATTYMGVDDRRDHSFRIPDAGKSNEHYGGAIAAGRAGGSNERLLHGIGNETFPPIARGTMLSLLESLEDVSGYAVIAGQLDDADPLVRIGALRAVRKQPPELVMRKGSHLLRDPVRAVRLEAALTYADFRDLLPVDDARAFADVADDYRRSLLAGASTPGAALNLAGFESRLGNEAAAARMYEHAMRIGANDASVQNAYGLYLVRSGDGEVALGHLRRAAELAPDTAWFAYVYGVALNSTGHAEDAVQYLAGARRRFPDEFDIAWALATMYRDLGDLDSLHPLLDELEEQFPDNPRLRALAEAVGN